MHLPVGRDDRPPSAHRSSSSTASPGSSRPSRNSSDAPPPVDRWSKPSASPNRATAARLSPPPATAYAGAPAIASRHPARARAERLELEHAHRPVPQDRLRVGDRPGELLDRSGADVQAHLRVRDLRGRDGVPWRVEGYLGAATTSSGSWRTTSRVRARRGPRGPRRTGRAPRIAIASQKLTPAFLTKRTEVYAPMPIKAPCASETFPANPIVRFKPCAEIVVIAQRLSTINQDNFPELVARSARATMSKAIAPNLSHCQSCSVGSSIILVALNFAELGFSDHIVRSSFRPKRPSGLNTMTRMNRMSGNAVRYSEEI